MTQEALIQNTSPGLIPLTATNDGVQAVLGRDLHQFLEIGKDYTTWFKDMTAYGFTAGQDFTPISGNTSAAGGRPRIDHVVSLDMAKEISMIQRTPRGKQAREYFIECEKRAKSTPQELSRKEILTMALEAEERAELEKARADEQEKLAGQRQRAIEAQAPAVAKAAAHSGVDEWKGRQDFAREVQQWGDVQGFDIKQQNVFTLLVRKGMLIAPGRADSGQLKREAVRAGWGRNKKGVNEVTSKPYTTPQLSARGQDIAWKWIVKAVAEYGAELNPKKENAAA